MSIRCFAAPTRMPQARSVKPYGRCQKIRHSIFLPLPQKQVRADDSIHGPKSTIDQNSGLIVLKKRIFLQPKKIKKRIYIEKGEEDDRLKVDKRNYAGIVIRFVIRYCR
jgi:hypothetical protein